MSTRVSGRPAAPATAMPSRPIETATFAIVSNGFADGAAQALRDWLVARRVSHVTTITHPLLTEDPAVHEVREWRHGELVRERRLRLPSRPPLTYPLDLLVPPWPAPVDAWLGFNALACWRGIAARTVRRAGRVAYWCVDYVDDRFGRGGPLTRAFETLDGLCCRRADARFEVSQAALDARTARHARSGRSLAPASVVPMGAWLDRVPACDPDAYARRRIVYLGHLVPRQGVGALVESIVLLRVRGVDVTADIIGGGPLAGDLRRRAHDAGLDGVVEFHGFVEDHAAIERIVAGASVAVAPYDTQMESFTRFADPGKLKVYLAAGVPIVLTDVPPNARSLAAAGAAELTEFSPQALAEAIERVLAPPQQWRDRRDAALRVAREYDWPVVLSEAMAALGFAD
jgi:glycosyltransferase involved in cell wall biosynthesis